MKYLMIALISVLLMGCSYFNSLEKGLCYEHYRNGIGTKMVYSKIVKVIEDGPDGDELHYTYKSTFEKETANERRIEDFTLRYPKIIDCKLYKELTVKEEKIKEGK